jgi:hypothetical protein
MMIFAGSSKWRRKFSFVLGLFMVSGASGVVRAQDARSTDNTYLDDAAFRDTFVFDPQSHTWSLLIESQAPGGGWANFAKYTLVHATR